MTRLWFFLTSVTTATTLAVILEKSINAFRISEAIGTLVELMAIIFTAVLIWNPGGGALVLQLPAASSTIHLAPLLVEEGSIVPIDVKQE